MHFHMNSLRQVGMGKFRTNVIVFAVSLVVAILMFEWSGVSDAMGVSWWDAISIIPGWFAIPLLLGVGVIWYINPD